jgi:hypothetical protein
MVNVKKKECSASNCTKWPSFGYPGERKPLRCATHQLEGMTNVRLAGRKRNKRAVPGRTISPRGGDPGGEGPRGAPPRLGSMLDQARRQRKRKAPPNETSGGGGRAHKASRMQSTGWTYGPQARAPRAQEPRHAIGALLSLCETAGRELHEHQARGPCGVAPARSFLGGAPN